MERTFKVFLILFGLLAITPGFPVVLAATDTPTLIVSETGFNFGELSEKTPFSHDFIVKNGGKATLNIEKVQRSWGCTVARFDRAIPPGGEGKVTLKVDLTGFQGYVKEAATIISDDPSNPRMVVQVEGTVKPLIKILPFKVVSFQGMPDSLEEKVIDLVTTSNAFHIQKMNDDLGKKAAYKLETVEDGTHYRLKISNNVKRGAYRGSITLYTDFPEKPELTVWVNGSIEGEIGVNPKTLVVGRLSPDQGVLTGKIMVKDNLDKPFQIIKCTYDERIIRVTQSPLPDKSGFSLEISPNMKNIPSNGRLETTLVIETDHESEGRQEVHVNALNLLDGAK